VFPCENTRNKITMWKDIYVFVSDSTVCLRRSVQMSALLDVMSHTWDNFQFHDWFTNQISLSVNTVSEQMFQNSSFSAEVLIGVGKLLILAWEQCGSNYIGCISNYTVKVPLLKCNNVFCYADNLGYLKRQETFWDDEAECILKQVQM